MTILKIQPLVNEHHCAHPQPLSIQIQFRCLLNLEEIFLTMLIIIHRKFLNYFPHLSFLSWSHIFSQPLKGLDCEGDNIES